MIFASKTFLFYDDMMGDVDVRNFWIPTITYTLGTERGGVLKDEYISYKFIIINFTLPSNIFLLCFFYSDRLCNFFRSKTHFLTSKAFIVVWFMVENYFNSITVSLSKFSTLSDVVFAYKFFVPIYSDSYFYFLPWIPQFYFLYFYNNHILFYFWLFIFYFGSFI